MSLPNELRWICSQLRFHSNVLCWSTLQDIGKTYLWGWRNSNLYFAFGSTTSLMNCVRFALNVPPILTFCANLFPDVKGKFVCGLAKSSFPGFTMKSGIYSPFKNENEVHSLGYFGTKIETYSYYSQGIQELVWSGIFFFFSKAEPEL